jgi:DEAD/DEAH box helicase domain-containing protein
MNLAQLLDRLRTTPDFMENVTLWHRVAPQPAKFGPWPDDLDPRLIEVMRKRGITDLYSHQSQAVTKALAGEHMVVVTPTASGKISPMSCTS